LSIVDPDGPEAIVGKDGRSLLEKVDDKNGIDAITSTAILFGKDESMELEWFEERIKRVCVQSSLDRLSGSRYLVSIFLPFLLLSLAYLVMRKKTDDNVT